MMREMQRRRQFGRAAIAVTAALLSLAGPAIARGQARGGGDGGPGAAPPILEPACAWDCRETGSLCRNAAYDAARACATATCPVEYAAYEAECASGTFTNGVPTEACRDARQALLACSATCWTQVDGTSGACAEQEIACVTECPRIEPDATDPACTNPCLAANTACIKPARKSVSSCHSDAGCRTLRAAAKEACGRDRASDACKSARDASRACFVGCRLSFVEAAAGCFDATKTCVDACPTAVTE